jgi:alginate O-acetyltransferase complex protein AlgI
VLFCSTLFLFAFLRAVLANWLLGLWIERDRKGWMPLLAKLAFNLGMLVVFKYADWLIAALSDVLQALGARAQALPRLGQLWPKDQGLYSVLFASDGDVRLPIGISFFTFQAMSYVIDVRRGEAAAQRNPLDLALYIALVP